MHRDPLLVAILGPTGSGKTCLSVALAEHFHGEIVNCDSVAVYRDFVIGTAKPTEGERARAPHHLFDEVDPTAYTTAGEYARLARQILKEISSRGALPIVVGGTGLYLRALLDGLFRGPERSEELRQKLRERAVKKGSRHLHQILQRLDQQAALKIHAHDTPKLIRAIEVCLSSHRPMSEQWQEGRDPLKGFRVLRIGLDPARPALYARINQRVVRMFEDGLIDETKHLLSRYGESARPFCSLGYSQVMQLLKGEVSQEATVSSVQQAHRNYSKRQMTWFRREPQVHWMIGFGDDLHVQSKIFELVEKNL